LPTRNIPRSAGACIRILIATLSPIVNDGKFTAHANPAMVGTDVRALKAKDNPLGQRIFDTINKSSGESVLTVDYNFPKPGTTEPVRKQSFVTKVGNQGCGVGYYK
jgi:hypothetical protein